jgi:hypothetical protein
MERQRPCERKLDRRLGRRGPGRDKRGDVLNLKHVRNRRLRHEQRRKHVAGREHIQPARQDRPREALQDRRERLVAPFVDGEVRRDGAAQALLFEGGELAVRR